MQKIDLEKLNRKNFRVLTSTLSMPGSIKKISPLYKSGLLAIANVLLYNEVTYFFEGSEDISLITDINNPKPQFIHNADYIFSDFINKEFLSECKKGSFANPDLSATLIFFCKDFNESKVKLSGPGIDKKTECCLPCDLKFISLLKEVNSNYPLGVEVFFLNEKNELLALSRTTKIEVIS